MPKQANNYRMLLFQLSHELANTLCSGGEVCELLRTLPSRRLPAHVRTAALPFPVRHAVLLHVFKKNVHKKKKR